MLVLVVVVVVVVVVVIVMVVVPPPPPWHPHRHHPGTPAGGRMPQGGAGKCGGNLLSSGGSKQRMRASKPHSTRVIKRATHGPAAGGEEAGTAPLPAYTLVRPSEGLRAAAVGASRVLLEKPKGVPKRRALRNKAAAAGEVLGGGTAGGHADPREARLRRLEQTSNSSNTVDVHEQRAVTQPDSAQGGGGWASVRVACGSSLSDHKGDDDHKGDEVRCHPDPGETLHAGSSPDVNESKGGCVEDDELATARVLLDDVARVCPLDQVRRCRQMLCTVLSNAADRGAADDKYRTLRARNEKLWQRLLRHQGVSAVLVLAGFQRFQQPQQPQPQPQQQPVSADVNILHSSVDQDTDEDIAVQIAQVELAEQLDQSQAELHVVESLLCRIQTLQLSASARPASPGPASTADGRDVVFIHRGGQAARSLARVLAAAKDWGKDWGVPGTVPALAAAVHAGGGGASNDVSARRPCGL